MVANEVVTKIIPAYPFVQYRDDPNIVAFFDAFNEIAQSYMDSINTLSLPYWPSSALTGDLLEWIALGIYGESRPFLQVAEATLAKGAYNTTEYDTLTYNGMRNFTPGTANFVPDDYFKRILTWNFYKGDGSHFCIDWLKRRVARFVRGKAGGDPGVDQTNDISITVSSGVFTISIPEYGDGSGIFLKEAIDNGAVKLPFIYSYLTEVIEQ